MVVLFDHEVPLFVLDDDFWIFTALLFEIIPQNFETDELLELLEEGLTLLTDENGVEEEEALVLHVARNPRLQMVILNREVSHCV